MRQDRVAVYRAVQWDLIVRKVRVGGEQCRVSGCQLRLRDHPSGISGSAAGSRVLVLHQAIVLVEICSVVLCTIVAYHEVIGEELTGSMLKHSHNGTLIIKTLVTELLDDRLNA